MADKAIPDISLGGAEQNMSREELAAVTKAVATLSPEDRGCFTSRGYLFPTDDEWQHDRPQAKQADRKPSIKERLEQSKQECRNKNKAQAPHKGKSEPEL